MNENSEYNSGKVTPYKATTNLNTAIGNPSVNINDTMNVNIKTVSIPNNSQNNEVQNLNSIDSSSINMPSAENKINNYNVSQNINNNVQQKNTSISNTEIILNKNNESNNSVNKTYVNKENQTKKKRITFNNGSEFKTAILIIVILLVFVFFLPIISDLLSFY